MGGPPRRMAGGTGSGKNSAPERPEELVADVDFGGLSLQAFVAEETEERHISIDTYSAQSVEECTFSALPFEVIDRILMVT